MSWTAEESLRFRRRVGVAAVPADPTRVDWVTGTVAQHPDVPRGPVDAPDLVPRLVLEAAEDQEQDLAHHPPRRSDLTRRPGDRGGLSESDLRHPDTRSPQPNTIGSRPAAPAPAVEGRVAEGAEGATIGARPSGARLRRQRSGAASRRRPSHRRSSPLRLAQPWPRAPRRSREVGEACRVAFALARASCGSVSWRPRSWSCPRWSGPAQNARATIAASRRPQAAARRLREPVELAWAPSPSVRVWSPAEPSWPRPGPRWRSPGHHRDHPRRVHRHPGVHRHPAHPALRVGCARRADGRRAPAAMHGGDPGRLALQHRRAEGFPV